MAKSKKCSKQQELNYKKYATENRSHLNRMKRLQRELKKNPNNEAVIARIAQGNTGYSRKTPKTSVLTNAKKSALKLIKCFTGRGDKNLISDNSILRFAAWRSLIDSKKGCKKVNTSREKFSIMSIGANARILKGV